MNYPPTTTGNENLDPNMEELQLMTDGEVNVWCSRLRADVINIQTQIENWHRELTPENWDDDWRDRADKALAVKRRHLGWARAEASHRHARNKHDPKPKPAKPATSKHVAFIYVARDLLDQATFEGIWNVARIRYPDLFDDHEVI